MQLKVFLFNFSGKKACSNNYFGVEQSSRPLFESKSAYSRLFSHLPPNQPKTANQNAVPPPPVAAAAVFLVVNIFFPQIYAGKEGGWE